MIGAFNDSCRWRLCRPVPRYPKQDDGSDQGEEAHDSPKPSLKRVVLLVDCVDIAVKTCHCTKAVDFIVQPFLEDLFPRSFRYVQGSKRLFSSTVLHNPSSEFLEHFSNQIKSKTKQLIEPP